MLIFFICSDGQEESNTGAKALLEISNIELNNSNGSLLSSDVPNIELNNSSSSLIAEASASSSLLASDVASSVCTGGRGGTVQLVDAQDNKH